MTDEHAQYKSDKLSQKYRESTPEGGIAREIIEQQESRIRRYEKAMTESEAE